MTGTSVTDAGRHHIRIDVGGVRARVPRRGIVACALMLVGSLVAVITALCLGDYPVSIGQALTALFGGDAGFANIVVVEWRLPRAVASVVFGAALGASGAIFQVITRNPLATPDIIGFTTGSYTGALMVIMLFGSSVVGVTAGSLIGGCLTALVIMSMSMRNGLRGARFVLVGIGISAALAGVNAWILRTADAEVALAASTWGVGTLSGILMPQLAASTLVIAIVAATMLWSSRMLGPLELGDDLGASSGLRLGRARIVLIVSAVLLVAAVTAFSGPIAFVALAAPVIGRRLAGSPGISVGAAACAGALILSWADVIAQHALPQSLPVGIATIVVGGAYLLFLLISRRAR